MAMAIDGEDASVTRLRHYLRIDTSHPNPKYEKAVDFLMQQATDIGLDCQRVNPGGDPIVVMTLRGMDPSQEAILLNSHMDVVAVYAEKWTYPPFEAAKTEDGMIYGRGIQDMKGIGMQHLEAVRRLKEAGKYLLRTIVLTFVPDEEVGGHKGMKALVESKFIQSLNIGFSFDESVAAGEGNSVCSVYYAERIGHKFTIVFTGNPGHGSRFVQNAAAEKFRRFLNSVSIFRREQEALLSSNPHLTLGEVTTVNLTMVNGGIQSNVIPTDITATFDCRVSPNHSVIEMEQRIHEWVADAGEGVRVKSIQRSGNTVATKTNSDSKYWMAFDGALKKLGVRYRPVICGGGTDSKYLRAVGVQAVGFSPLRNTPDRQHAFDECLHEDVFLEGIDIFEKLIEIMANIE